MKKSDPGDFPRTYYGEWLSLTFAFGAILLRWTPNFGLLVTNFLVVDVFHYGRNVIFADTDDSIAALPFESVI